MTLSLNVETRTERGKQLKHLRSADQVPGVVYGPKETSQALKIKKSDLERVIRDAGESSIIVLKGLENDTEVLVHDVAFDPTKGGVVHIDFYAIERGKELTTNVPLEFIGEPPIEKHGGTITKILHEIEVTCRPSNLPHHIEVDLSGLSEFGMDIKIEDLNIPEGVTVDHEPDEIVAKAQEVIEEEEEEPEEIDMDAIEVEEKGKAEDEGGEADGGSSDEESEEK